MPKRFVNIDCGGVKTRINVTDMEDLTELHLAVKEAMSLDIGYTLLQLWAGDTRITKWCQFNSLPVGFFSDDGCSLVVRKIPTPSRNASSTATFKKQRTDERLICDLTSKFKAFKSAQLIDDCIFSPSQDFLPYSQNSIAKVFVRVCYKDVFALLMKEIESGTDSFGICGTPGIGKSLFFVYILYRLMENNSKFVSASTAPATSSSTSADCSSTSSLSSFNPKRIIYQTGSSFEYYDLEEYSVARVSRLEVEGIVRESDTFYIIDGSDSIPVPTLCFSLFIASPWSRHYKEFVKQNMATEWFFPVWSWQELESCRVSCYTYITHEILYERHKVCGGIARLAFHRDVSISIPKNFRATLSNLDAVRGVTHRGDPSKIFPESHELMHMLVGTDQYGRPYQFLGLGLASKYIGEQLWERHSIQMMTNLNDMFCGSPNEISRRLFEIYGHRAFSRGGRTLKCRNLSTDEISELKMEQLDGERISFGKDSVPGKPILKYYEPSDDDNFPANVSLSPHGVNQFTVESKHPIRGVMVLKTLCECYDKPKLYFVAPPHCFKSFSKQNLATSKGQATVNLIAGLEQYVLELPID